MRSIWEHNPPATLRALAQYLGKTEEGHAQWLIEGHTYTGSVSTYGGGVPLIGREYPAWCNDPDNRSQWVVLVRSSSKILPKDFSGILFGFWLRYGARFSGRFWLGNPAQELSVDGEAPSAGDWIDGFGLICLNSRFYWTNGTKLKSAPISNPLSTSEYDFEHNILATWSSGSEAWCLTEALVAGYDEGYAEGFAAAYEATDPGSAYYLGGLAWTNGDPYDPNGSNPGPGPIDGSEDYQVGYLAGWNTGWDSAYLAGWEGAGGSPP